MNIFEWVLVINLFISLYLAYNVYSLIRELEDLDEILDRQFQIIGAFMDRVIKEKVNAGEWSPHETL